MQVYSFLSAVCNAAANPPSLDEYGLARFPTLNPVFHVILPSKVTENTKMIQFIGIVRAMFRHTGVGAGNG